MRTLKNLWNLKGRGVGVRVVEGESEDLHLEGPRLASVAIDLGLPKFLKQSRPLMTKVQIEKLTPNLECANGQISSSCGRSTLLIKMFYNVLII